MSQLKLQSIEAGYGSVRALQGISLSVEKGTMVALLGANGAGKSTTQKVISGMLKPNAGDLLFEGKSLLGLSPNQIVRLGIAHVPEGRKIFKDLMVSENLQMGAYTRSDRASIKQDLEFVLEMFPRLRERSKQLGGSLSGGEQQMLAIGRGLMARPSLLLLDEPSLGIAPNLVIDIFASLRKVNQEMGMTMLIVEQNAQIVLKNTSFGFVMQVGKIAVQATSDELRKSKVVLDSYMGV